LLPSQLVFLMLDETYNNDTFMYLFFTLLLILLFKSTKHHLLFQEL